MTNPKQPLNFSRILDIGVHLSSGEELVTIKAAMGHANITTTEIYVHAIPATELAARFTKAFTSAA